MKRDVRGLSSLMLFNTFTSTFVPYVVSLELMIVRLLEEVFKDISLYSHLLQAYIARKDGGVEQDAAPQSRRAHGSIIAAIDA